MVNAALERIPVGGTVTLTVDLAGDGLIVLEVARPIVDARGVAPPPNARVVAITASTAREIVNGVVNTPANAVARTVANEGGVIVFGEK